MHFISPWRQRLHLVVRFARGRTLVARYRSVCAARNRTRDGGKLAALARRVPAEAGPSKINNLLAPFREPAPAT